MLLQADHHIESALSVHSRLQREPLVHHQRVALCDREEVLKSIVLEWLCEGVLAGTVQSKEV